MLLLRRIAACLAVAGSCAALAACGPAGPLEARGSDADPIATLTILPSPGALRGDPAQPVDEAALQRALTGATDPALVEVLEGRGMKSAAVRSWTGPGGQRMVASVSVWESHLLATGIGGQAAERLMGAPGAQAWTPRGLRGSRGVRVERPGASERRLALAVGPNTIYVRSEGPVPEDVVTRTASRLAQHIRALD
jgi:hypothetical protein